jgi:hypothetical protein
MKKIILIIISVFLTISCRQDPKDVLIAEPKTPCDFVHNKNLTFKRMIPLMNGKKFDDFIKNKNSKEFKEWFELFSYFSVILAKKEKNIKFTDSSYDSCPEYKEMQVNCKRVFDNHVSF